MTLGIEPTRIAALSADYPLKCFYVNFGVTHNVPLTSRDREPSLRGNLGLPKEAEMTTESPEINQETTDKLELKLTEKAIAQVKAILARENLTGHGLRVSVDRKSVV